MPPREGAPFLVQDSPKPSVPAQLLAGATGYTPYGFSYLGASFGPGVPEFWPFNPRSALPGGKVERPGERGAARRPLQNAPTSYAGATTADAPPNEEEDDDIAPLGPARHILADFFPERRPGKHAHHLIDLLIQMGMAGSLAYLLHYSDLLYLVGLRRSKRAGR